MQEKNTCEKIKINTKKTNNPQYSYQAFSDINYNKKDINQYHHIGIPNYNLSEKIIWMQRAQDIIIHLENMAEFLDENILDWIKYPNNEKSKDETIVKNKLKFIQSNRKYEIATLISLCQIIAKKDNSEIKNAVACNELRNLVTDLEWRVKEYKRYFYADQAQKGFYN